MGAAKMGDQISIGDAWVNITDYSDSDLQALIDELRDSIDEVEREMEERVREEK